MMPSLHDRWVVMWLIASAIYAVCKGLTWWTAPQGATIWRQVVYLFAWPGMDASAFLLNANKRRSALSEWAFALAKVGFGAVLLWVVFPRVSPGDVLLRGWVGMVGIVFVLHFGF